MKIVASIQARLGSSRLPGKVLKDINGKPMLYWHVKRLQQSRLLDDIIVATTTSPNDEPIVEFCKKHNFSYFRGSEDDVLDRVASLIELNKIDIHVELFGDSPLTDAHIIDEYIGFLLKYYNEIDFVSNSIKTTYPPGQEVLVYKGEKLIEANKMVDKADPMREHVSIHIYKHPEHFNIMNLEAPPYYRYPNIFMEVDTPEDFIVVSNIFKHFFSAGKMYFTLAQILDYLKSQPEITKVNQKVERRWKEFRDE